RMENPVWHIHNGNPPTWGAPITFALLLNLVSAANAETKAQLWSFISKYAPGVTAESHPFLDKLAGYALAYYEDFVKPPKKFREATEKERRAFEALIIKLETMPADFNDATLIQNEVFEVGKTYEFEPLRDWFKALYEVLLGQEQGPRFGSFAAIFGVRQTAAL